MTIGDRIKNRREELGLTVDELAVRLGKHRATVYRYENGDIGSLPASVLEPLARALETTPGELMGFHGVNGFTERTAIETLTEKECVIIEAYRAADERTQRIVELTLGVSD